MSPIFISNNLQDTGYAKGVGEDGKHLKARFIQNEANAIAGIGFNLGNKLEAVQNQKRFQAVYSIDENEWQGKVSLQLKIRDIK